MMVVCRCVSDGACECVFFVLVIVVFFKQKTAYEMRISDWSSDVCSSDLQVILANPPYGGKMAQELQTNFRVRSGATECLFLQHIMANLAKGGQIGRASCGERVCQYV